MGRLRKKPLIRKIAVPPDEQTARRLVSEASACLAAAAQYRAAGDFDGAEAKDAEAKEKRGEAAYLRNRLKVQGS